MSNNSETAISLVHRLPEKISGQKVQLISITPSAWNWVSDINEREEQTFADDLGFNESERLGFSNQTAYNNLCVLISD